MIRARLSSGDFLFGLDAENIRRLTNLDMPIVVDLATMGGPAHKVFILYGPTQQAIIDRLEEVTGQKMPPAQPDLGDAPPQ